MAERITYAAYSKTAGAGGGLRRRPDPSPARDWLTAASFHRPWAGQLFGGLVHPLLETGRPTSRHVYEQQRTGPAGHVHQDRWTESDGEQNSRNPYIGMEVVLGCGCKIESLGVFAGQMREQKGLAVATSVRWSYCSGHEGTMYSLRVRRKSLAS
ncbi:hypothetical protein AB0A77_17405 [Streptomyces varsoviensis]|uniref:hypothetical protein n=1 Tax=Streptomyces varsoviensis TaxID=67373 RepID=UPI0033DC7028